MGQQQLLLLVLATVIVGLATVAGIQAFEQGSKRAEQDALTQTSVKIASDIQANLREPEQFGGAGMDKNGDYEGSSDAPSLGDLGYDTNSSNEYETAQGKCTVDSPGSLPITVTCQSTESDGAKVEVEVQGLSSDEIKTVTQTFKDSGT
ncbi:MAG: hypothetical protein BRD40_03025 [Bacteroidetes bacterium QS_1_65_9]|nr:MAG: hypothetical protein BRD40_03025 [Bacteroidetes bacterium QS_1_65_9]